MLTVYKFKIKSKLDLIQMKFMRDRRNVNWIQRSTKYRDTIENIVELDFTFEL